MHGRKDIKTVKAVYLLIVYCIYQIFWKDWITTGRGARGGGMLCKLDFSFV